MSRVFAFSLTAALNPSLLAAVTVMLTLPSPRRLLSGYFLGAALTSVTCGLLLAFLWPGSSTASTAKRTINPVLDLAFGVLVLLIVARVARGRADEPARGASTGARKRKTSRRPAGSAS